MVICITDEQTVENQECQNLTTFKTLKHVFKR